ncbi:MAG: CocE/NonD family hydrolase, partial [Janthinobacterium lividum]
MKKSFSAAFLLTLGLATTTAHAQTLALPPASQSVTDAENQAKLLADTLYIRQHYTKTVHQVPMRDGVKLYTVVYAPKDADQVRYPILLNRTPYSVGPYPATKFKTSLGPSSGMMHEGYIFAYQDVRGRYMSEGEFLDMRPELEKHPTKNDTDEGTDTFDTIEYLLKHGP